MMGLELTCQDCRFYRGGTCRRYAPRPTHGQTVAHPDSFWPPVGYGDWCGEFESDGVEEDPERPEPPPPRPEPTVKPTKAAPCPECQSICGKHFHAMRPFATCPICGAMDEIPF